MADATASMVGKTVVVTGATSGIGEVAARELAAKGARVVVVGRSPEKCEATGAMIRRETGSQAVETVVADLSSQASVRRLAEELKARCPKLDVLVNNAGAIINPRKTTVDGIEMTWALNHLAYFLLTDLLLDTLKAAGPARIVSVSSEAHRMVSKVDFDDPQGSKKYGAWHAYGQSKLANVLFTRELARRLEGSGVTANCLHPGLVRTNFTTGEGFLYWAMRRIASVFAISPEEGAKTTIHLASSPEVEGVSGQYFAKSQQATASAAGRDDAAARRLWELSEQMVSASA